MQRVIIRFSEKVKNLLLYAILTLLFLQFIKDTYPVYYLIVAFFISLSLIILLLESNFDLYNFNFVSSIYAAFLILLITSAIISLRYNDFPAAHLCHDYNIAKDTCFISLNTIIFSVVKMLLMPAFVIYVSHLVINKKSLDSLILLFILFVCLASFSLFAQLFFGHISIFGPPNAFRFMGFTPYSSSIGAVTTYATAFAFASIMLMLHFKKLNFLVKFLLLSILLAGAVASMGKAAIANIILVIFLLLIFLSNKDKIRFIIYLICAFILMSFNDNFFNSFLSLFANTFGIDFSGEMVNRGIYVPFYERVLDRFTGRNWTSDLVYLWELFIGWGTVGGGGAFGIAIDTSAEMFHGMTWSGLERYNIYGWEKTVNTTHNQLIDLFQIGGFLLIFTFVVLFLAMQYFLFLDYWVVGDTLSKALFVSNIAFIINAFVFNGILFQPYLSFIFWISVVYFVRFKNIRSEYNNV